MCGARLTDNFIPISKGSSYIGKHVGNFLMRAVMFILRLFD